MYATLGTVSVAVATPERREAVRAGYASGTVQAEQMARLRTELAGEILQVPVREGGEIRQGELVMEMEVTDEQAVLKEYQMRVTEANALVRDARDAYEREQALLDQLLGSQEAVDNARARYDRALGSLRSAQSLLSAHKARLGKGKMSAPITGVVTKVNVSVGDIVPPNLDAVTILDPASFKVYAEIDERDINRVRPGQLAVIAFDAMPERRFHARVERIIPQADQEMKTLPVVLNLVEFVPNLSHGLTATVNIVQERHPDALTIPAESILHEKGGSATLYVVTEQKRLELRTIRLGIRGDDYVEVLEGLNDDERVVLNPDERLEPGQEVTVAKPKRYVTGK